MQAEVGDRLVFSGRQGTRIGVVVDVTQDGSLVRWADGGENVLSVGTDAPEAQATWEAAKAATGDRRSWRPEITAGVGHEAALALAKLDRAEAGAAEEAVEEAAEADAEHAEAPGAGAEHAEAPGAGAEHAKAAEADAEHPRAAGE